MKLLLVPLLLAPICPEKEVAVYPTGMCDTIAEEMPGLNDPSHRPERIKMIGTSVEGRPIWTEFWGQPDAEVMFVVVAQVHGNECSPSLLVEAIRHAPDLDVGIWLIPTINPDGYYAGSRKNTNGQDLNADGRRAVQPETQALFRFVDRVQPDLVIHVHSPSAYVGSYGGSIVARRIADALGFGLYSAGERDRDWFLWQGLDAIGYSSINVELHPVSSREVPRAVQRARHRSVENVREEARLVVEVLNQTKEIDV